MQRGITGSKFVAVGIALLAAATQVRATALTPGSTVVPDSVSYSGMVLADTGLQNFSFAGNSGTVQEIVVKGDPNNPFGSDALEFIYQANVQVGAAGRITGASFAGFLTDVSAVTGNPPLSNGSATPIDATRSTIATDGGAVVGFDFVPEFSGTSLALIVRTNATNFQPGTIGIIDGGGETKDGFAPAAVPEPGSLALFGLLGLGLAGRGVWRRRQA